MSCQKELYFVPSLSPSLFSLFFFSFFMEGVGCGGRAVRHRKHRLDRSGVHIVAQPLTNRANAQKQPKPLGLLPHPEDDHIAAEDFPTN